MEGNFFFVQHVFQRKIRMCYDSYMSTDTHLLIHNTYISFITQRSAAASWRHGLDLRLILFCFRNKIFSSTELIFLLLFSFFITWSLVILFLPISVRECVCFCCRSLTKHLKSCDERNVKCLIGAVYPSYLFIDFLSHNQRLILSSFTSSQIKAVRRVSHMRIGWVSGSESRSAGDQKRWSDPFFWLFTLVCFDSLCVWYLCIWMYVCVQEGERNLSHGYIITRTTSKYDKCKLSS